MRKIISRHDEEKRARRNRIILGCVLVAVMLFSTLGYAFRTGDEEQRGFKFGGYTFIESSGYWVLDVDNVNLIFSYNPLETGRVGGSINELESYYGEVLNIYSESDEAGLEIYRNLFYENGVVQRVQSACLGIGTALPWGGNWTEECEEDVPSKACDENFVLIIEDDVERIAQQDSCVFITAPAENLTKVSDEFLFKVLDIV